jgi:uncharacterized membrane protein (UPF0127 family)
MIQRAHLLALPWLLLLACGPEAPGHAGPGDGATALPRARVRVGMHVVEVEVAETVASRARGLSGRRRLPEGTGMLFVYPRAGRYGFWMPDMHFDLDLVWIRGDRVVGITARVPHDPTEPEPPVYHPPRPVDLVLEVPAGTAARLGWQAGDPVAVEREDAPDAGA